MPRTRKGPGWTTGASEITKCKGIGRYTPSRRTTQSRESFRQHEYRWQQLPYGCWFVGSERVVMFNRRYKPLLQQWSDGRCEDGDPGERVPFTRGLQFWFYDDSRAVPIALLEQIKSDFLAGRPLAFEAVPARTWDGHGALVVLKGADPPPAPRPVARRGIVLH